MAPSALSEQLTQLHTAKKNTAFF
uniref:Uncharacterized protein n=1 Tax=Anguilla anguilla TaxID=7936 RepID=A0A0E9U6F7_ANGAN